jgi:chromosome segregation ATPase
MSAEHAESTSAALRRVEADLDAERDKVAELAALYESATAETARVAQERDALAVRAADLEQVRAELRHLRALADGYMEDIKCLESGQDSVADILRAQRDSARAELESARTELEHLPTGEQLAAWIEARNP